MATFSSVTRQHLLQAIEEHDDRGAEAFLALYGFEPAPAYPIVHEGRSYDSTAILGVAHRFATGRLATAQEFLSDPSAAVGILRKRGFEVTEPRSSTRIAPARAPRVARAAATVPRAPRTVAQRATVLRDTPQATCPTCSMVLPATGRCDDCD